VKFLLTIAASDGSGCAGIQQDLRVMDRLGYRGISVQSAITLQNIQGLSEIIPLADKDFESQLKYYLQEFPVTGIKLGALCTPTQVEIAAQYLNGYKEIPLVADPVFAPTRGTPFLTEEGIALYRERIVPLADLLIPNMPEWQQLFRGSEKVPFHGTLYISGGHSPERKIGGVRFLKERIIQGNSENVFFRKKRTWAYSRGTGCAFSSAACAFMSRGIAPERACVRAGRWVTGYFNQMNRGIRRD